MKKVVLTLLVVLVAAVLKLYFDELPGGLTEVRPVTPTPVDPKLGIHLSQPLSESNDLGKGKRILNHKVEGLETVEPHPKDPNVLYGPDKFGKLLRIELSTETVTVVADIGGRGLGLKFAPNGDLYVANEARGLQVVNVETGSVQVATNSAGGKPINFADDVDIDSKGVVYFSDASSLPYRGEPAEVRSTYEILGGVPTGRLLRYDPTTKQTDVLIDGLLFSNGVALSDKEDFVLIAETGLCRIHRYWLAGDKAGQQDLFVDGLPGHPDGIRRGKEGRLWMPLFERLPPIDFVQQYPDVKRIMLQLSLTKLSPPPKRGIAVCLSQTGELIRILDDRKGVAVAGSTAITEHDSKLFFGNLNEHFISVYEL